MGPRIGVYVCHCGVNIAATVDVEEVTRFAQGLPSVAMARDYTYMCSDPGQALIKEDIKEFGLTKVVVASCSPMMHEPTFRGTIQEAGLNPYCLEMANIREQCSWVHEEEEEATRKAIQLVAAAVDKAFLLEPLEERRVAVTSAALVIGGGIAGMQAALDIANAGFQVYLVEKEPRLGGHLAQLDKTFPTLEPVAPLLAEEIREVEGHPNIDLLTSAEVIGLEGYIGNFKVNVTDQATIRDLKVGTIVVATGYDLFDARLKPEYGYGIYEKVITGLQFERLVSLSGSRKFWVNEKEPQDVLFIQCVGSRDKSVGHEYCSRICCMYTAKQALLVKEMLPQARVTVLYMDVRAYGKGFEEFYDQVRGEGVLYRRGNPSEIYKNGKRLIVRVEDTLLGEPVQLEADLVVLATGITPRRDSPKIANLLKLPRSPDGFFMEAHPKLRPVDTVTEGIYLAGCCQGPKDIPDTVAQAKAAAASAMIPLCQGQVKVEAVTSIIDEELCSGCGICAEMCVYDALSLHERKGVMTINEVLCKGCGACAAACPSKAIKLSHFTPAQILAQVDALV
ncbi:MAG: CoB--CoM heterodisulfide reductase iron-sulfur subunit A family protein [Anaerolineae bacterium]